MRATIRLLLLPLLLGGCSTLNGPGGILADRHTAAETEGRSADYTRGELLRALRAGADHDASPLLDDDFVLVLPGGNALAGAAAALAGARQLVAHGYDARFVRQDVRRCLSGFEESGTYEIAGDSTGTAPSMAGGYVMHWGTRGGFRLVLQRAEFHPAGTAAARRPCPRPQETGFAGRRTSVVLQPAQLMWFSAAWKRRLADGMSRTGWPPARGSAYDRKFEEETSHSAALRVRLTGPFLASAVAGGFSGAASARNDQGVQVHLSYGGRAYGILPGLEWGPLWVSAGPALVPIEGEWRTTTEPGSNPGYEPPPGDWSLRSRGLITEIGALLPLTSRIGFDLRLQHRHLRGIEVPGYRGTDPFTVDFSHPLALLGGAIRF